MDRKSLAAGVVAGAIACFALLMTCGPSGGGGPGKSMSGDSWTAVQDVSAAPSSGAACAQWEFTMYVSHGWSAEMNDSGPKPDAELLPEGWEPFALNADTSRLFYIKHCVK